MKNKLKHPPYYAIEAYEILARKTEKDCAEAIGKTVRTYQDKKKGLSDFTKTEADTLAFFLGQPLSALFLTDNVSI